MPFVPPASLIIKKEYVMSYFMMISLAYMTDMP